MQNGSMIRAERQRGPDVWEFRWREPSADGRRKHRRIVLGSVQQLADEADARQAIAALRLEFNRGGAWLKTRSASVSELVTHFTVNANWIRIQSGKHIPPRSRTRVI